MSWTEEIRGDEQWSLQREWEALDRLLRRARLLANRLEELRDPDEYDQA